MLHFSTLLIREVYLNQVINWFVKHGKKYIQDFFASKWETILHDGFDPIPNYRGITVEPNTNFLDVMSVLRNTVRLSSTNRYEVQCKPDPKIFDTRYANNAWLQEMPEPMSKLTWDNVILISPDDANRMKLVSGDVVKISYEGRSISLPVWIMPGHAHYSITIWISGGRTSMGHIANGVGVNGYKFLRNAHQYLYTDVILEKTEKKMKLASTQQHHSMENRALVREGSLKSYRNNPRFANYENTFGSKVPGLSEAQAKNLEHPISLFQETKKVDHEPQWGMSIDLNSCIGCGVCTIACQSENNIPIVGKDQVMRGREMHWIRVDRYFEGEDENIPNAVHQPLPCMHCENGSM